jgi:hypothetical protein
MITIPALTTEDLARALATADESGSRYAYWNARTWRWSAESPNPPAGMVRAVQVTWPADQPDNLAAYASGTVYVWPADVAGYVAFTVADAQEWGAAGTVEIWNQADLGRFYNFGERLPIL